MIRGAGNGSDPASGQLPAGEPPGGAAAVPARAPAGTPAGGAGAVPAGAPAGTPAGGPAVPQSAGPQSAGPQSADASSAGTRSAGERPDGRDRPEPVIAVDAMGGDNAPDAIVTGAITAYREWGIQVVLIGRPGQIRPLLSKHGLAGAIRLVTAEESVAMDEGAAASWRRPRSSIAVACQLVHLGQATAVMSAGSTGAIVTTARLRLRNLPGVQRPALAVVLPTRPSPTLLIDAGAVADPKPEMLVQFAQLGVAFAEVAYGIAEPSVGLLNIGAEPGKGNKLIRRVHELLSAEQPLPAMPLRFAGNVEGGDLLRGKVDVVVADGFSGNVALKTLEGTAAYSAAQLRAALAGTRSSRLGMLLQRRALSDLAERMDPETYGGAALLGLEGTVVIAHGASGARGAAAACRLAADLTRGQITEKIRERLGPQRAGHFLRRSGT